MVTGDSTYCANDTKADLMAMGGSGDIVWSTNNAFTSGVTVGATRTPSSSVGTTVYYVREELNGCAGGYDSVEVVVQPIPTFTLTSSNTTDCATNDGEITVNASGGSGSVYNYTVERGSNVLFNNTGTFTGLSAGTYSVDVEDSVGCSANTALRVISAPNQPSAPVTAGQNKIICDSEAVPYLVASAQGSGTLNWYSDANLNTSVATSVDSILPSFALGVSTYWVTEIQGACEGSASTVTLTVNETPAAPNAGADASYCFGTGIPNLSAQGVSGATVRWYSDASLTNLIGTGSSIANPNVVPGTYTYYVNQTASGCASMADTVTITINNLPTAPLVSTAQTICFGDVTPTLVATPGDPNSDIRWYANSALTNLVFTGNSFTPAVSASSPNPYRYWAVERSAAGCQGGSSQTSVTIRPTPSAPSIVSMATDYCEGEPVDTLTAVGASGTYTWKDDNNTVLSTGGTYFPGSFVSSSTIRLTETNSFGCESAYDEITINVFELPTIDSILVTDVTGGCTVNSGSIELFVSGGTGNYTVTLYSGSDTIVSTSTLIDSLFSANYLPEVFDGNCAVQSQVVSIDAPGRPFAPVIANNDTTYCEDESMVDLMAMLDPADTASVGAPIVIRWYSDAANTNQIGTGSTISPASVIGVRNYYAVIDNNGCVSVNSSVEVTRNPQPASPAIGSNVSFCDGDSVMPIIAVNPSGTVTWFNDTTQTNQVAQGVNSLPVSSILGVQYISATITSALGCESTPSTITVTGNTLPVVGLPAFSDVCTNSGIVALNTGTPSGGSYSGQGVLGSNFSPSTAGAGTKTITYTYTDGNGCVNAASNTIEVNPLPVVTVDPVSALCADASAVTLTATPAAGTFSGNGVTGTSFDPSAASVGNNTITYTYTDANNCTGTGSTVAVVNPLPIANAGIDRSVCIGSNISLNATGGVSYVWSNGDTTQSISVSPSVQTTYVVTVTNASGCVASDDLVVSVDSLPSVSVPNQTSVCEDANAVALSGGQPAGGFYSGNFVVGFSQFNVPQSGTGTFTITYNYTDGNGCTGTDNAEIIVNQLPSVTFASVPSLCADGVPVALVQGSPSGGLYAGPGVANNELTPSAAGTVNVTYTYTDGNGCSSTVPQSVTVNSLPVVSVSNFADVCEGEDPIELTGGTPSGGIYSGSGVAGNFFNPSAAGTVSITYSYLETSTGCSNADTASIVVNPTPVVAIADVVEGDPDVSSVTIDAGNPGSTYLWSTGETTQSISVSPSNTDVYTVTVTNASGCVGEGSVTVTLSVGIEGILRDVSLNYYPNPSEGMFNMELSGLGGEEIEVSIMSIQGQVIRKERFVDISDRFINQFDLRGEASGIYLVRVLVGDEQINTRITVR
jgi:hypothetical protein